jgi:DNA-binding transcriptional MerR regulator
METTTQAFNIQFVSNITGINPHTIRAWEKRYKAINPQRDHNGRRLYQQDDIDRLNLLYGLVRNGNSISDIAHLPSTELEQIHQKFIGDKKTTNSQVIDIDIKEVLANLHMGLEFFKLDIISHELSKASEALNPQELAMEVVAPLVIKIRMMKQDNLLNEKQRTAIFLIIKSHIIKKLFKAHTETKDTRKIVLAAPDGELNEMGIMIAALLCQHHKVDFYYMGSHVKDEQLAEISQQLKADVIFLGINYSVQSLTMQEAFDYQERLLENMDFTPEVWVGTFDSCSALENFRCIDDFKSLDKAIAKL